MEAVETIDRQQRAGFVESVVTWLPTLDVDVRVARRYASLLNAGRRAGVGVNAHDGMIAATAQVIDALVLTRNRRHFAAIPGTRIDGRST